MTTLPFLVVGDCAELGCVEPQPTIGDRGTYLPTIGGSGGESESFLRLEVLFFLLPSTATWTTTSDLTLGWTVYAGALGSLRSCLCVAATTDLTLGSLSAA